MSKRSETVDTIVSKAQSDSDFRQALLSDPAAAVSKELGAEWPSDVSLRVVEETPQEVYIVLPPAPKGDGELSDDQLASVAGGGSHHTDCSWGATCGMGSIIGDC
ncbi:NHLP leader peptide family RiPP precursor [Hoyosella subflava]|uniref:Nitrile hydratase alpha /Thiocyanate hydrolase gamma domain-containing protein n=1 Tax=Hoyosella subflava (strain DSM 45089 / JCM 17490 / NBRC 109087 / DQS3-9A1) TaxID=443218 RepID=F6EL30_HOYSD|nr:NHLP leader peptide family RiPP precursor [Hoyosella subflava]AEF42692.1 hypothetical protein AS9A_4259 [Hoyosella subflava DQS3-9A1]